MSDTEGNVRAHVPTTQSRLKLPTVHAVLSNPPASHILTQENEGRVSLKDRAGHYGKKSGIPCGIPALATPKVRDTTSSDYAQTRTSRNDINGTTRRNPPPVRPQTATGSRSRPKIPSFSQSVSGRPGTSMTHKRNASRMDGYNDDGRDEKRNGTIQDSMPSFSSSTLRLRRARSSQSMAEALQSLPEGSLSQRNVSGSTDASVTRAMERLHLDDIQELSESRTCSSSSLDFRSTLPSSSSSVSSGQWNDLTSSNLPHRTPKTPRTDIRRSGLFQDPKFHSLLPTAHPNPGSPIPSYGVSQVLPFDTSRSRSRSPQKSPAKLPQYLTKGSNVPILTAFDIENKEALFGEMWSKMKGDMNDTMLVQSQLQESLATFKAKGM